jgi:hypothetical protein
LDTTITDINKNKSQPVLILYENRKLKQSFNSIREVARYYETSESSLRQTYLNKNRLFKGKYYVVKDTGFSNKRTFSTYSKTRKY